MCLDPVTMGLSLGASALGNYMTQKENNDNVNRQYNARNAVQAAGAQQQAQNQQQANQDLDNTINQFSPTNQSSDLGSLIANRTSTIKNNMTPSAVPDPAAISSAPRVVQNTLAQKMADATTYATQQAGALGAIGGTNDQNIANNINIGASGSQLGALNTVAHGQAVANQAEANAAYNNARKSANPLWGVLGQLGNAGSMFAAGGGDIGNLISPGAAASTQADANFLASAQNSAGLPTGVYGTGG